jgi:hypothetical protein
MTEDEPVVAVRPPTGSDIMWEEVKALLTPDKSIQRIEEKARFVVSTVTVVGTLITGLGLVLGTRITSTGSGRVLATISVSLAAMAVVLSVGSLVVGGIRSISPANLIEVRRWYAGQHRRGKVVGVAGLLLILSILFGAVGASRAMVMVVPDQPNLTASITSDGKGWDISAEGQLAGLAPKDGISIALTGIRQDRSSVMLARQVSQAGTQGDVSVSLAVKALKGFANYRFDLTAPNMVCSVNLSSAPAVTRNVRIFVCSNS